MVRIISYRSYANAINQNSFVPGANAVLFLSCLSHGFKRGRWIGLYLCALSLLATAGIVMQILWHLFTFYEGIQLNQSPMQFAQDNPNHPIHLSLTWIFVFSLLILLMHMIVDISHIKICDNGLACRGHASASSTIPRTSGEKQLIL